MYEIIDTLLVWAMGLFLLGCVALAVWKEFMDRYELEKLDREWQEKQAEKQKESK